MTCDAYEGALHACSLEHLQPPRELAPLILTVVAIGQWLTTELLRACAAVFIRGTYRHARRSMRTRAVHR